MSTLLDFLSLTVLFIIPSVVLLSVPTDVPYGSCKCPNSISVLLIGTNYCEFIYNPPHSAYAAYAITDFITLANMSIGPLKSLPCFSLYKNIQLILFLIFMLQGMHRHCQRLIPCHFFCIRFHHLGWMLNS